MTRRRDGSPDPSGLRRPFDLNLSAGQARPVPRLVNLIVLQALRSESQQVHLDSGTQAIEFLLNGKWTPVMKLPPAAFERVINRIRVMAGLDRTKGNTRQDGTVEVNADSGSHTIQVQIQFTEAGHEEVYFYLPPPQPK